MFRLLSFSTKGEQGASIAKCKALHKKGTNICFICHEISRKSLTLPPNKTRGSVKMLVFFNVMRLSSFQQSDSHVIEQTAVLRDAKFNERIGFFA